MQELRCKFISIKIYAHEDNDLSTTWRACNKEFKGISFEEIADQSKKHGMEMYQQGDKAHIEAMEKMKDLMQTSEVMTKWFEEKEIYSTPTID